MKKEINLNNIKNGADGGNVENYIDELNMLLQKMEINLQVK